MTADVDRCVHALLDWIVAEPLRADEALAVLARTLTIYLEGRPLEELPPALHRLWVALDDAMTAIEDFADETPAPAPVTRQ